MKRLIGIILLVFVTSSASAQLWVPSTYGNSYGYGSNSGTNLSKGYRGMVEMGHGFGFGGYDYAFKFSTTHGYQFNPYIYLGGFVSLGTAEYFNNDHYGYYYNGYYYSYNNYWYDSGFNFRIGADFRAYMSKRRFAPFVGIQFGYDFNAGDDYHCIYVSAQAGFRVALKNRMGLNLAVQVGPTDYFESCEMIFKLGYEF